MAIHLRPKQATTKGIYLVGLVNQAETDRGQLITKRNLIREMYFKAPGGETVDTPWEGAVSLHLPIIKEKIETAVPKVVSALWRADPFVTVRAPGEEGYTREVLKRIERFLTWAFRNDIRDFYMFLESFIRNMLIDGTAFAKIRWERTYRRGIDHHIIETRMLPGDVSVISGEAIEAEREKTQEEVLAEVFGFGDIDATMYDFSPIKGKKGQFRVRFTEGGRKYEGVVSFNDTGNMHEIDVRVDRKFISYDAPIVENIELEDIVLPYRANNVQDAKWVCHKTRYTMAEIRKLVEDGDWKATASDLSYLQSVARAHADTHSAEAQKDEVIGESGNTGAEADMPDGTFTLNSIEIYEIYLKDTVDDGDPMDVIYFVSPDLKKVMSIEMHDDQFPHGMRPFVQAMYIPVSNRAYGIGMAELLYAINKEIDHLFSHVSNMMEMITMPFFFYTPYGMMQNQDIMSGIKPGSGIPTTDTNSVRFVEFAQQPLALLHASSQTLLGYADRMTFSPSVGGSSNYRNAPRTARGTLALMDAAEERLSSIVEQMQANSWKQMVIQVAALYGMYVASEKWFQVTGDDTRERMNTKVLRSNLQMEFSGSLTSTNRDVQRTLAERMYLVASKNPLYNSDPRALQQLLRRYLESMSEGSEVKPILPSLPGEGGFTHVPMDQDSEIDIMTRGFRVDVLPVDDHRQHLAALDAFAKTPEFKGLDPKIVLMIAEHRNAHEAAHSQAVAMQNRIAMAQAGESPEQAVAGLDGGTGGAFTEPGIPMQGIPAMGGEISDMQGGIV